ncbi:MAG TPA: putative Fe-S cluster assembly protein SufT [Thermoanaerobaculia bacterium]|nr:putative Fe-S cluster assembly protein SufT [Thermoanaerobaculia bacterium]
MYEKVTVGREIEVVQIPSGQKVVIPAGAKATITQSLGGSYTLMTERGLMVRVSGSAVSAIGKAVIEQVRTEGDVSKDELEKMVWDQLKTCFDPEIPVNIVDLGLVYLCDIKPAEEPAGEHDVAIKMTLTAPACGMGPVLAADVEQKVRALPKVHDVKVDVVFDPVWDRSMMSEAARLQLGMYY